VKLFSKYSNYVCEPSVHSSVAERHRQMDGRTTYCRITGEARSAYSIAISHYTANTGNFNICLS